LEENGDGEEDGDGNGDGDGNEDKGDGDGDGDANEEVETEIAERDQGNKCFFVKSTAGCNELGRIYSIWRIFYVQTFFPNYCTITLPDFPPTD
jgi:hypothetical protein